MSTSHWPDDPVVRHHNEDYDRRVEESVAEDLATMARSDFARGDYASLAAHSKLPDLAVHIAEDALEEGRREAERQRQRIAEKVAKAGRYLRQDEPLKAELELNYLVEQGVRDFRVHFLHGLAVFRGTFPENAAASFANAERLGAPVEACGEALARCALRAGRPGDAIGPLDRALGSTDDPELRTLRAHARLLLKGPAETMRRHAAEAARDLLVAIEAQPDRAPLHLLLGRALWRSGRPEPACEALARARDLGLESPELFYLRALALVDLERLAAAEEALDTALEAEDSAALRALRAEVRRRRGRHAEAVEDATRLIELEPGRIRGLIERGRCRLASGDGQGALKDFSLAERMAKRSPQPPFHRARCLLALGRRDEAEQAALRALELGPGYPPAEELLARCRRNP